MRIDFLKSNLGHIVLLAKEYKEKITAREVSDIERLHQNLETQERISAYDREFLSAVRDIKCSILRQVEFFAKKMLDEFATDDKSIFEVDTEKVELARKLLTTKEMDVLGSVYKLIFTEQCLERDEDGKYRKVAFREIEPALDEFVDSVP